MKKVSYSKDVDILLIELSEKSIAYAENDDGMILHYSEDNSLVLIEIMDFQQSLSEKAVSNLSIA